MEFESMNAAVKGQCVKPLHQLAKKMVGLNGLEPSTSRLSGVRSNHLSYKPIFPLLLHYIIYIMNFQVFFLKYKKWCPLRDSNPRPTD